MKAQEKEIGVGIFHVCVLNYSAYFIYLYTKKCKFHLVEMNIAYPLYHQLINY